MEIFMSDKVIGGEAPELVLARWATQTRYEDLPSDVVAGMKLLVRTILGTAVAGSSADGCGEVIEQVRQWRGVGWYSWAIRESAARPPSGCSPAGQHRRATKIFRVT